MAATPDETCDTCRYWDQGSQDPAQVGVRPVPNSRRQCRRFPPLVFKEPKDWCGEHQQRPGS